uniref:Uncharacterized protein n=1 Tax=viral metagenome TaxID=1070528 RepID=A0A6C0J5T9_9ZZZZ
MESSVINTNKDNVDYVKYENLYFINNEYVFLTTQKRYCFKKNIYYGWGFRQYI